MKCHFEKFIKLSIALMITTSAESSENRMSVINGVNIPAAFREVLSSGMPIPIQVKYLNDDSGYLVDYLATATIILKNESIQISHIDINDKKTFSNEFSNIISNLRDIEFDQVGIIDLEDGTIISLDLPKLLLVLHVPQYAFAKQAEERSNLIGQSSVDSWSSVVSYNLGLTGNRVNEGLNKSNIGNYVNVNTVSGINEHHVYFDSSFYGIGTENHDSRLRRLMYEKDYEGSRFAFGILSGWDLQSLGQVSALNAERIWGVSIGNQSRSSYIDTSRSFTPIFAFLPAAGEVRIYKDERLISIQNFTLGNKEIDTSSFPSGLYDVLIEVVVNGTVVSQTKQRVDKYSFSNISESTQWQLWGGFMEPLNNYRSDNNPDSISYLLGMSGAKRYEHITLSGSIYSFSDIAVGEFRLNNNLNHRFSISSQMLLSTDESWRFTQGISFRLWLANLWASYEKSEFGEKIHLGDNDSYGFGTSLMANQLWNPLGTVTFNQRYNRLDSSHNTSIDYYQYLYSSHKARLGLRLGYNEVKSEEFSSYDKNISLELNVPLNRRISTGVTRNHEGSTVANLEYQERFHDGAIKNIGFSANKSINSHNNDNNNINSSGYLNYSTKYIQGSVMANRSALGDWNTNMTANGNIGLTSSDVVMSSTVNREAGVIVKTGLTNDKSLSSVINGRAYVLSGDKTFITLDGYNEYTLELHNNKENRDSFDITEYKSNFTLYPGNIYTHDIRNSIREMVTVFGILKDESGEILSNVRLNNHIGSTITDKNGEFVIDVDKNFPVVTSINISGMTCQVDLDLIYVKGATWVDEIICYES